MRVIIFFLLLMPQALAWAAGPYQGELIDAYSTIDHDMEDYGIVIQRMQKAGVNRTVLGAKGGAKGFDLRKKHAAFAQRYSNQLVPVLKIMSGAYRKNKLNKMEKKLGQWLDITDWKGLGDLKLYDIDGTHQNNKNWDALTVKPTDPRVDTFMETSRQYGWPMVMQIKFAQMPAAIRNEYLQDLEAMLSNYSDVNVVLAHLGQLHSGDIRGLLKKHKNLNFDLSRSHPAYLHDEHATQVFVFDATKSGDQGEGAAGEIAPGFFLAPEWWKLLNDYPDRFLVAFYNASVLDWDEKAYMENTAWFRKMLGELKPAAADLIAHGNAKRLWNLQ